MNAVERDDLRFLLQNMYEMHGRKFTQAAWNVWWESVFAKHDFRFGMKALKDSVTRVRYLPTPKDVADLIAELKLAANVHGEYVYKGDDPLTRAALQEEKSREQKKCNPKTAAAWAMFLRRVYKTPIKKSPNWPELTWDEAVQIVNSESIRLGHDLPEKYRIPEMWAQ